MTANTIRYRYRIKKGDTYRAGDEWLTDADMHEADTYTLAELPGTFGYDPHSGSFHWSREGDGYEPIYHEGYDGPPLERLELELVEESSSSPPGSQCDQCHEGPRTLAVIRYVACQTDGVPCWICRPCFDALRTYSRSTDGYAIRGNQTPTPPPAVALSAGAAREGASTAIRALPTTSAELIRYAEIIDGTIRPTLRSIDEVYRMKGDTARAPMVTRMIMALRHVYDAGWELAECVDLLTTEPMYRIRLRGGWLTYLDYAGDWTDDPSDAELYSRADLPRSIEIEGSTYHRTIGTDTYTDGEHVIEIEVVT